MAWLADRPWRHLASPLDYFYPTAAYNLRDADDVQHGRFLPYLHRTLRVPGDFVSRCMQIRIDDWRQDIQRFLVCCDSARKNAGEEQTPEWETIQHSLGQLNEGIRTLRRHCFESPKARLRDSCVALVQVYAGYRQQADLNWLGDVSQMVQGVADMRHRVTQQRQWEIPERIAEALHDVAHLLRENQPPDAMIEEMKSRYRLVLVEGLREGYLDGTSIDGDELADWHGRHALLWELLWLLAERATIRQSVDRTRLTNPRARERGERPTAKAVRDRRSDLKKLISEELNALIEDAGPGTYRLSRTLEPGEICLLGWVEHERLEVLASTSS
ncbi:hypothetical protein GC176_10050 [bacterium]|nr:hypothetical protein [bacterium]